MTTTLRQRIEASDNRWDADAAVWAAASNAPLCGDVVAAPAERFGLTITVSVVVSAFDAATTLAPLLRSIENSSLHRRFPDHLEVIVVDDGSTDGTWVLLSNWESSLRLRAVRQLRAGQARALNTGIAVADGDLIVALDADMLLSYWSLEEAARRHQVLPDVLLVGFRTNLLPTHPEVRSIAAGRDEHLYEHRYAGDNRFAFDTPGWPENMVVESDAFLKLGFGHRFWVSSGQTWDLPRMVYGCLFSLRRASFAAFDGFDERNYGWGWMDTTIGARAIGLGHRIVPLLTMNGIHVKHPPRSVHKWEESRKNLALYERMLDEPSPVPSTGSLDAAAARIVDYTVREPSARPGTPSDAAPRQPARLIDRAIRLQQAGHAAEAIDALAPSVDDPEAAVALGRIWRLSGQPERACEVLASVDSPRLGRAGRRERAFALGGAGEFRAARDEIEKLLAEDSNDTEVGYALHQSRDAHVRRARAHREAGFLRLARRDLEAALIQSPEERELLAEWRSLKAESIPTPTSLGA